MNWNVSFSPTEWFVFNTDTGQTIERGFKSKKAAVAWAQLTLMMRA